MMYTIGQLVERTGFSRDTIVWYIRIGLITYTTRIRHYRLFDNQALERLERIKELRAPSLEYPNGMPLDLIRQFLEKSEAPSSEGSTHGVL